jgi:CMP-N-acetylneuraminic acid synthetase
MRKSNLQKVLAVIPARGGSKGIPQKNLKPILNKPLIAYTIESALNSKSVNRVIVSTDDEEIGSVSRKLGAEVIWRPTEISGDHAASEDSLLQVLEQLEISEGYQPDLLVFLQCTSPLTSPEDINGTIKVLLDEDADSALAVSPFHYFLWEQGHDGNAVGINHDKSKRLLRQQRKAQFIESGSVYVMRVEGFRNARHRFFGKTAMYNMPNERCLEIDDPVDLDLAEFFMEKKITGKI